MSTPSVTPEDRARAREIALRIGQRIVGELGPDGVIPLDAAADEIAEALATERTRVVAACAAVAERASVIEFARYMGQNEGSTVALKIATSIRALGAAPPPPPASQETPP